MFHVIFQVKTSPDGHQSYLDTAARLRPLLDGIEGFLSIERYRSLERERWLLSLSKWADEAALVRWRIVPEHHVAQEAGRRGVFEDYRLRVGQVASLTTPRQAEWTPERRTPYRQTQGPARFASVVEVAGPARAALPPAQRASDSEWYESLTSPGKYALALGWPDEAAARRWHREAGEVLAAAAAPAFELGLVELERDYGLMARAEAPQYYPPVRERDEG